VLPHQPHEVIARVAHVVLGLVLVPVHAHVAVDGIKPLRHGAAALDVGLLDADDLQVASPVPGFVSGAAPAHSAAHDVNVRIDENGFATHYTSPFFRRSRASIGRESTLSASGSCASSCELNAAAVGGA